MSNQGKCVGIPTGFGSLDKKLGGLRPGGLVVCAARPGMGKSSLAMNIAEHNGLKEQTPVGVFSLEMSEDELNMRALGSYASVNMADAARGYIPEQTMARLSTYIAHLSKAPIHIIDRCDMKITQLRAEARRMVAKSGVKLIIVDYLQLVAGSRRFENRTQEVGEVSRGLKAMARELSVPVLALAQLNREIDRDAERRPRLSDLRDSGSIEQDADQVLFIYCPTPSTPDALRIVIAKNRFGAQGEVNMRFDREHTRFSEAIL